MKYLIFCSLMITCFQSVHGMAEVVTLKDGKKIEKVLVDVALKTLEPIVQNANNSDKQAQHILNTLSILSDDSKERPQEIPEKVRERFLNSDGSLAINIAMIVRNALQKESDQFILGDPIQKEQ